MIHWESPTFPPRCHKNPRESSMKTGESLPFPETNSNFAPEKNRGTFPKVPPEKTSVAIQAFRGKIACSF